MKKNNLMYLAGGVAGALVGVLVLWIVMPVAAGTKDTHEHTFETVTVEELKSMLDRNAVTVIDVRNVEPYLASHIPGALQIPVAMIQGEIPYLPKDKTIVTYCSCPAEESSGHAAMVLANGGITNVKALKGGFDEWTAKGLPTRSGREAGVHP